jgi:hypothetical protein
VWYNTQHVPEQLAVPGFQSAARYASLAGIPAYMVFYELDNAQVHSPEAWATAANTAWTRKIRPRLRPLSNTGQHIWWLRPRYQTDDLCTSITWTFDNLEVSRIGFGTMEKLAKLSDLVNFFKGEIFPCVLLPAKEPCMQTTIFQ